jgi:hypothetical protein
MYVAELRLEMINIRILSDFKRSKWGNHAGARRRRGNVLACWSLKEWGSSPAWVVPPGHVCQYMLICFIRWCRRCGMALDEEAPSAKIRHFLWFRWKVNVSIYSPHDYFMEVFHRFPGQVLMKCKLWNTTNHRGEPKELLALTGARYRCCQSVKLLITQKQKGIVYEQSYSPRWRDRWEVLE